MEIQALLVSIDGLLVPEGGTVIVVRIEALASYMDLLVWSQKDMEALIDIYIYIDTYNIYHAYLYIYQIHSSISI